MTDNLDELRHIEGFPIGEDEDLLALSDPPHYTAYPNPHLGEFIDKWGTPYDEATDDYHREPYVADVSEGKNDPIYNAHSYHTKVPYKAIIPFIEHYTEPGDIVFDGFCGTGMTDVAAQMVGRRAILCDLSPAATFIAYNYNRPVDVSAFDREGKSILTDVESEYGWMYETWHPDCDARNRAKGRINYTVWSDVFLCPYCGSEIVFWETAVDVGAGQVLDRFDCPHCHAEVSKRELHRAIERIYDSALGRETEHACRVPVLINYSVGSKRYEKKPDAADLALIRRIEKAEVPFWYPASRMPEGDESRRNDPLGMTHTHHFYSPRSLWILSALWHSTTRRVFRAAILGGLGVGLKLARFRAPLWFNKTSGPMKGHTSGTLYMPSLSLFSTPQQVVLGGMPTTRRCVEQLSRSRVSYWYYSVLCECLSKTG